MVKLTIDQIPRFWPLIRQCVDDAIPGFSDNKGKLSSLLRALLLGTFQCWFLISDGRLKLMAITTTTYDEGSGTKNLYPYVVRGFGEVSRKEWAEAFVTIKRFAKSLGCHRIIGYTKVESLKRLAERLGGNTEYTFVSIPI